MEIQKEIDKAIYLSQKGNFNKAKRIYERSEQAGSCKRKQSFNRC